MLEFWNQRYSEPAYAYGTEPNDFLKENFINIPKGNVLCLAEGEGRNAVYLAQQGYNVTMVDQSQPGLDKAAKLAKEKGVEVKTIQADLGEFKIEPDSWDGIISIFGHLPPAIRQPLHQQVVAGLKPGGIFVLEAYTPRHIEINGIGGPPKDQKQMFMSLQLLELELKGLEFIHAQELERTVEEGEFHKGTGAVVQVIGKK